MKYILLFTIVSVLTGCSPVASAPLTSPTGNYAARTEISGDEAGTTKRLCVKLKIKDLRAQQDITFQTGASDVQKWAIDWSTNDVLVLYSSDIGTLSYDIHDGVISERLPTPDEQEVGRRAYETKYRRKPNV